MKPKMPTTPLFLFYRKKRAYFLKKYPGVKQTELSKLMAAKFAKLSAAKKVIVSKIVWHFYLFRVFNV
jgi:HMG (high mobility group) box